ncbi:MAG: IS701 family transposase [Paraclostridium sp.]
MIINEKSTLKTLKTYLFAYREIFYKRSFEIFTLIIISVVTLQKVQSIKFIYDKFISKFWNKKLNSFYYFLNDENHSIDDIMRITTKIATSLIQKECICDTSVYLTIDDTLQPKFGEKFDNRYKLFDHAKHNGSNFMNGHCIVSMTISVPVNLNDEIRYLTIPLGYRLYDKSCTKLELAKEMITAVIPELTDFQVIVLCDSWYTKKPFLTILKNFKNLKIIGALRSDTVLYGLKPDPTGKPGRPRLKGDRLNFRNFDYTKEGEFFVATTKCMTNLYDEPVTITVTTKDLNSFSSTRLYLSSISIHDIKTKFSKDSEKAVTNLYDVYKLRWNIEVMFYQQKLFWSFGTYMVRSKVAIEKYINLIGIAYSSMILIPFISCAFEQYKFCSPQEIKHVFSEAIREELFFSNLLKIEEIKKNLIQIPYLRQFKDIEDLAS